MFVPNWVASSSCLLVVTFIPEAEENVCTAAMCRVLHSVENIAVTKVRVFAISVIVNIFGTYE
jgi:peroxiredoxin